MAEVLEPAHPSISDRPDLKEVDVDRNVALAPSGALADESQDAIVGRLDELKRLLDHVDPVVPKFLGERDDLRGAPKML